MEELNYPQWLAAVAVCVGVAWQIGGEVKGWLMKPAKPPVELYRKGRFFVKRSKYGRFQICMDTTQGHAEIQVASIYDHARYWTDGYAKQDG